MKSAPRCSTTRRTRLLLEELETRQLLTGIQPSAVEQLFLEELNDARANPPAYGASIGLNLSDVAPAQPLAFDPLLIEAARNHSWDMSVRNYFAHNTPEGIDPGQRISAEGISWTSFGESIAAGSIYPMPADALKALIIDAGISDLGHRKHLLAIDALFKPQNEVGIGVILNSTGWMQNYYTVDSASTSDTRPFITGVVINDHNNNGKYDLGEGLAGVTITVNGVGSTTTFDSGGYSIPVNPGTYTVTASGGALLSPVTRTVTVGATNARLTFTASNDVYIQKLYQTILGRAAPPEGLAFWSQVMNSAGPMVVASAIEHSSEARGRMVQGWFTTYLGRAVGTTELQAWTAAFQAGATETQLLGALLATPEYYAHAAAVNGMAASDTAFLQTLYSQLLGRTIDAVGLTFWRGVLPSLGRGTAAAALLASAEYRGVQVASYFRNLLKRPIAPAATDLNFWATSAFDLTTIRILFETTPEYIRNG